MYGNKGASPFETHGLVMMLFIASMLIHSLVAVATLTMQALFKNHPFVPVLNQISIAFGVLACDLLLVILAPPFGYFFLVIWLLLLLLVLLYTVFNLVFPSLLRDSTENVKNYFRNHMAWGPRLRTAHASAPTG
ncbi:hypothetical protein DITRI_Ditri16bG0056300 [Diplodiscus trichospermus]